MPELVVGQAGKELTHNQALAVLDQLAQAVVADKDLTAPPGSPANGSMYIVAAGATGAWASQDGKLAYWLTTVASWTFITPADGWSVWVTDEAVRYERKDGGWGVWSIGGGTLVSSLNEATPVTLSSAATVNIGAAASNTINISGTTTVTAFDVIAAGAKRTLIFTGVITLTHNSTSLILPGAANIITAAGDTAELVSVGGGNWRCLRYQRANGDAVAFAYDRENVTGTVSQLAGVPTGAIIESGTNANGAFVRFADGTQTCSRELHDFGSLGAGASANYAWTFPAVFSTATGLAVKAFEVDGPATTYCSSFSTNSGTFTYYAIGALSNSRATFFASGRWF